MKSEGIYFRIIGALEPTIRFQRKANDKIKVRGKFSVLVLPEDLSRQE